MRPVRVHTTKNGKHTVRVGIAIGIVACLTACAQTGKNYSASLFPRPSVSWNNKTTALTAEVGELATSTTAHLRVTASRLDGRAIKPLVQTSLTYPTPSTAVLDVITPLDWAGPQTPATLEK